MKKFIKRLLFSVLIGMLLLCLAFPLLATAEENLQEDIGAELGRIHVLNTGWEDAVILESGGRYALIDAGEPGRGPYIVDYLRRLTGCENVHLDFVIGTHSHIDHMGGFKYILSCPDITVGKGYVKREVNQDRDGLFGSVYYREFIAGCESGGIEIVQDGLDNLELSLGSMKVTLLNGAPLTGGSTNPDSLCQLVEAGGFKALLAADMVTESKELGVYAQIGGTVDFLKVGHHGQSDSTGRKFADHVRPKAAVYTSGSSWEADTQDVTLGVKKGLSGYNNLNRVGAVQYVTTDNGGVAAVFGENGMTYRAIKEFTKRGEDLIYEYREEIDLRPITQPSLNFFERAAEWFQAVWNYILELSSDAIRQIRDCLI
ncbi:MAG: MBL fold metallo-hydrolase [Oscillospiraceae bacterium]|nr:MBL fold metallo-hydrolase [Oscillospiraceae bacterium]